MNPLLVKPVASQPYISTKSTWVRRGREAIEINISGAVDMLPVWISMAFLRASGDFSWTYVMLVCTTIVNGNGKLLHAVSGEQVDMLEEPQSGEYVYMPNGASLAAHIACSTETQ